MAPWAGAIGVRHAFQLVPRRDFKVSASGRDGCGNVECGGEIGVVGAHDSDVESTLICGLDKFDGESYIDALLLWRARTLRPTLGVAQRASIDRQPCRIRATREPRGRLGVVGGVGRWLTPRVRQPAVHLHSVQLAGWNPRVGIALRNEQLSELPWPEVAVRESERVPGTPMHVLVVDEHNYSPSHLSVLPRIEKARQSPRGGRAGIKTVCRNHFGIASCGRSAGERLTEPVWER